MKSDESRAMGCAPFLDNAGIQQFPFGRWSAFGLRFDDNRRCQGVWAAEGLKLLDFQAIRHFGGL